MLLLLAIFVSVQRLAGAPVPRSVSPLPLEVADWTLLHPREGDELCAQSGDRSIWDIIWSCVVTIFVCTWVAVHPNIPSPTDSGWCIFKRGISTMIYALIAPELMVTWALHQYLSARQIMHKYNSEILQHNPPKISRSARLRDYVRVWFYGRENNEIAVMKWTKTHGFFLQMGGFMLHEAGQPVEVLTYHRLKTLIHAGKIDIPRITGRTISDKSKGDYLSKVFTVVQTTWFVAQCGARWAQSLPLAEVEVVTLAFAILNAITYALWLDKPQNVQEAIRIDLKVDPDAHDDSDQEKSGCESWATALSKPTSASNDSPHPRTSRRAPPQKHRPAPRHGWLRRHLQKDYSRLKDSQRGLLWFFVYRVPYRIIISSLRPMKKLLVHSDSRDSRIKLLRVSMFSRAPLENPDPVLVHYIPCLIGVIFGLVHVLAWSSGPTEVERGLWKYSTLVITIEPLLFAIAKGVTSGNTSPGSNFCLLDIIRGVLILIIWLPFTIGLLAYVIARVILFTQALASLRALPPAVYRDVDWTVFVPHL